MSPHLWRRGDHLGRLRRGEARRASIAECGSPTSRSTSRTAPTQARTPPVLTYRIEHRLFSFITANWRGKPLVSHKVIVELIAATTTQAGLKVRSQLDTNTYPSGIKISRAQMQAVNLKPHTFHEEWNYTVEPNPNPM